MEEVVIAGIGQLPVGEFWDISLRSLATRAILAARKEVPVLEPDSVYIANSMGSVISHQANLGSLICDWANLLGAEGTTVEASGASGAAALHMGYQAVASGMVNVAVVVGVEKVTDSATSDLDPALTQTLEGDYEAMTGLTPSGQAGLIQRRYMHQWHMPEGGLAGFSINAHANAVHNRYAMFRKAMTREQYDSAEVISDPVRRMDIAPSADGAAAVILTRPDLLPHNYALPVIRISGSSIVTDTLALHDRQDTDVFLSAEYSSQRALRQAELRPDEIDLFELDDAYSIYAALALEAAGFAERGQGWKLACDGEIILHGRIPVSTMGGSKARGNPIGATGVYQAVEAVQQLRGQAGANQVANARRALIQNWGGPASTVVTHVLERM